MYIKKKIPFLFMILAFAAVQGTEVWAPVQGAEVLAPGEGVPYQTHNQSVLDKKMPTSRKLKEDLSQNNTNTISQCQKQLNIMTTQTEKLKKEIGLREDKIKELATSLSEAQQHYEEVNKNLIKENEFKEEMIKNLKNKIKDVGQKAGENASKQRSYLNEIIEKNKKENENFIKQQEESALLRDEEIKKIQDMRNNHNSTQKIQDEISRKKMEWEENKNAEKEKKNKIKEDNQRKQILSNFKNFQENKDNQVIYGKLTYKGVLDALEQLAKEGDENKTMYGLNRAEDLDNILNNPKVQTYINNKEKYPTLNELLKTEKATPAVEKLGNTLNGRIKKNEKEQLKKAFQNMKELTAKKEDNEKMSESLHTITEFDNESHTLEKSYSSKLGGSENGDQLHNSDSHKSETSSQKFQNTFNNKYLNNPSSNSFSSQISHTPYSQNRTNNLMNSQNRKKSPQSYSVESPNSNQFSPASSDLNKQSYQSVPKSNSSGVGSNKDGNSLEKSVSQYSQSF